MKKIIRNFKFLLISFTFIIFNLMSSYANVYSDGNEAEIENKFNSTILSLKEGDYEVLKDLIYVSSIEKGNSIIDKIPEASDVFGWLKIGSEVFDDVTNITKIHSAIVEKVFKTCDFSIESIYKESTDMYKMSLNIDIPNCEFYDELDKKIAEFYKKGEGKVGLGLKIFKDLYLSSVPALGNIVKDPDILKYLYAYDEVNYLEYNKKILKRTINIIKEDGDYKIDISNLVGFDLSIVANNKQLEYKGDDVDDKNLYNFVFIPMWKIIGSYYKLSNH